MCYKIGHTKIDSPLIFSINASFFVLVLIMHILRINPFPPLFFLLSLCLNLVLRMELDIKRFMLNSDQHQFEFQHFPTSYLRLAAHRVAQHYGLQSMVLDTGVDGVGNKIVVRKTPESRCPTICLSEITPKQPENDIPEQVKIAIRPRPNKGSQNDMNEIGNKQSTVRTVEERKEEYDRARARIFSSSSNYGMEGSSSQSLTDGRSLCLSRVEHVAYRNTTDETEKNTTKDNNSRVAIFRDKEKDRSDPDYDRSYDRYRLTNSAFFFIC